MTAFSVPKSGAERDECEDALAFTEDRSRFALADGASDSAYPAAWARSLVTAFIDRFTCREFESSEALNAWLAPQRKLWREAVPWDSLPWYGQEKAERGAFATFLGCEFTVRDDGLHWHAVAVGDTCLVHLREGKLLRAFPVTESASFTNTPGLIGSSARIPLRPVDSVRGAEGVMAPGDVIVLATDALAQWLLREIENAKNPVAKLSELNSDDEFAALVKAQRGLHLQNDDTTMILIRREPPSEENG